MNESLENTVERLLALRSSDSPRIVVGLAGMPGSGKSTLAARLEREVNARAGQGAMVALGMDGFHLPKAALRQMADPEAAFARRGAPWTFDVGGLAARLGTLREAAGRKAVGWPDFQHCIGDPVENAVSVEPATRLILVEGLYLLLRTDGWESVSSQFDERWYLDTPLSLSMARLAERHMASWDLTREVAERKIRGNDGLNAEIVMGTRDAGDWIIRLEDAVANRDS